MRTTQTSLIAVVLMALGGNSASAQPVCLSEHFNKLEPIFSSVGHDVAVSASTAVVGVPGVGSSIGKAIVFNYDERNGWLELQELVPPDGEFGDSFGRVVAIEDDIIAIASLNWDDNGSNRGSVYVFRHNEGGWSFEQKLFLTDGPPELPIFGRSIAIDGARIAIGATGGAFTSDCSTQTFGRVYVFEHKGGVWVESHLIEKDNLFCGAVFGTTNALDLRGDLLIGGARGDDTACPDDPNWPKKDSCVVCNSGVTFIFRYDAELDEWIEEAELMLEPPMCSQQFGRAVAIDGERALIAANFPFRVYIYQFDADSADWVQSLVIHQPDIPGVTNFGDDVELRQNTALIGARAGGGNFSGSAFVYQQAPSGTWTQRAVLSPEPNICCGSFGRAVSLANGWAIIGAPGESPGGAAYIYDLEPLSGDMTCDDVVDVADLLLLLNGWGACPAPGDNGTGCPADLDGDGVVNVSDLLELLANWG